MRRIFGIALLSVVALTVVSAQTAAPKDFVRVQGTTLQEKLEAALRTGRSSGHPPRIWSAFGFDVRSGVAIDLQITNDDGSNWSMDGSGLTINNAQIETRNLAVLILRDTQSGEIVRVTLTNLDRDHDFSGYPIYWMDRISNDEMLSYLKPLALSSDSNVISERATEGLAVLNDARVNSTLIEIAKSARTRGSRVTAINWLGHNGGGTETIAFLSDLVRNGLEETEVRDRAVKSLGRLKAPAALAVLTGVYPKAAEQSLRHSIINAVGMNDDKAGAVRFLLGIAADKQNEEERRIAMVQLSLLATRRIDGSSYANLDIDTEIQREAVIAISRRETQEATPLLINIARTHPNEEIRKQAILSLGRIGDDRATQFFKDALVK